jgi:peptide/nickel transport system permease protein
MNFLPVILWSDALVFLLLAGSFAAVWYVRRHEHLQLPWRRLGNSRVAMVSLLILSLFVLIGILDTLHYRVTLKNNHGYSPEVLSVFDYIVEPLRLHTEKTYSAPLAISLYTKESSTDEMGRVVRTYPRLVYGGARLSDVTQHSMDVLYRVLTGAIFGLLSGILLLMLLRYARNSAVEKTFTTALLLIFALLGITIKLAAAYHVLGTDKVGQDVLYLSLKSIRTGLVIGTVTTLVTLPLALFLGVAAGYFRGWVDDVIQYLYTVLSSIPGVLLIAAAVLTMQVVIDIHPTWFDTAASRADLRLVSLCLILGMTSWTGLCRLLRGETLKLRELDYIMAAQSFGVSSLRILTRHIIPNLMHIIIISLVMDFSGLVLSEAVLSYVGVGVDPSMISFGTMINGARLEMARDPMVWWSLASAFVFMLTLVLSANLFADAVQDAFNPKS